MDVKPDNISYIIGGYILGRFDIPLCLQYMCKIGIYPFFS